MDNKLVSIIIPTYNDSENLVMAIESCLHQTYKNIEILICDDGSNDATPEIIKEYTEKYPNKILYYRLKHLESPAIARNVGIKNAKGDFISFLDSDDLMFKNKIEKQVRFLEDNTSIDIVCSNAIKFSGVEDKLFYKTQLYGEKISFKKLLNGNNIINSTVLIKKSLIEDIGFFYERTFYLKNTGKFFYEDYEYWIRASLFNKNIFYSSEILIKYRINCEGISQNSSKEKRIVGLINTLKILLKTRKGNILTNILIINKILFYKRFLYKQKIKDFVKKLLKLIYSLKEKIYYTKRPSIILNTKSCDLREIDIVTTAFNNPGVILYQIKLLRKYLIDSYCYTVADNSTNAKKSDAIMNICKKERVSYIRLPNNPYNNSVSHGVAMNWIYKNYIVKRKAKYFGFIDHDIFPTSKTSIVQFLKKQSIYGHYQERNGIWYLGAGFSFFRSNKNLKSMNFKKGAVNKIKLDTGGMNWKKLYSKINKDQIKFPSHYYKTIRNTDGKAQSDKIEFIGGWLHLFNASGWLSIPKQRERNLIIVKILENLINK